jgi:hypothetical protein
MIKPGGTQIRVLLSESSTVRLQINGIYVQFGCHTGFLYGKDSLYLNRLRNPLLEKSGFGDP